MGEELDNGGRLRRRLEEGGEVGGVEVHGRVPAGGASRLRAPDAERPERVRAGAGGEDGEGEEEGSSRRGHGSRRAWISRLLPGRDLVIRFGHLPPLVESPCWGDQLTGF